MSLITIEKINEAVKRRPAEIEEARAQGRKVVGWLNYAVPEELIYALDLIPVHLGTGGNDRLVELGSRYISVMNCVFTRQVVGAFQEGKDEYIRNADLVVIDVTCKQLFRVAELIRHYFQVNTEILGVPYNFNTTAGRDYFRREVRAFAEKLEKLAGKKLDPQKLSDTVALYDGIRSAVRELYHVQAQAAAPISWREVYEVVQAGYYLDKAEYFDLLRELLKELETAEPDPAVSPAAPRIFLSGSVIPPRDRKVLDIIEQVGGRVVADDLWSGYAPYFDTEIATRDTDGIADAYLYRHPHASLPNLDIESDRRLTDIDRLIEEFEADAVLFYTLRYCDCFTFKGNELKSVLKQRNVPFLEIHTEYAGSDYEAIHTRLEAFVESLSIRKSVTKAV